MPQMYPLNWMLMFMLFVLIFMFTINKIFYIPQTTFQQMNLHSSSTPQISNLWKW